MISKDLHVWSSLINDGWKQSSIEDGGYRQLEKCLIQQGFGQTVNAFGDACDR